MTIGFLLLVLLIVGVVAVACVVVATVFVPEVWKAVRQ